MALTDGMSQSDLQSRLAALQAAFFDLQTGTQVVSASYGQGDSQKTVTFRQADKTEIQRTILMLQKALGLIRHYPRARRTLFMR